ncbi:MAG: hypothetical protein ABIT71_04400 [Vicinamibacteraceae bacterium]
MADTLRSLAGDRFKNVDIITEQQRALTPEQVVLDRYVFMPHARSGIAAALTTPFDWGLPTRATVEMRVPVIDDRGGLDAEMTVHVYGPADVTEIDPRQVIRAFPKADVANAEVDDLVHVEFDRPDLPWLFTPAGPDGNGRLVPWITLVVVERRHLEWGEQRGAVRRARIRRDQLQPLGDAWAWAHAQVMGAKGADRDAPPTLEARLGETNAAHNLSRLICPRRLDDRADYIACVVPTFLAGAQTGLGLTPATTLAPAWGTKDNFAGGDPLDMVALPVYFSWSFATGEEGNFESLARKLLPAIAPPGVGRRRVDATRPWPGLALAADDPGAEMVVTGPVVSPQLPENSPEEHWPTEAQQLWDAVVTETLTDTLNRADRQGHAPDPGPPLVGPPLYGGTHAKQPRLETDPPAAAAQPAWFRELNADPRHRIAAGLGTRVVQMDQEDLMLSAWNQVIGIEAANRALRLAQLAARVGTSLHRRHLSRFTEAMVVATSERVHAKLIDTPQRSVWASIAASSLPPTVTTGAFRRMVRVRGPIVTAAVRSLAQRAASVDALTVRTDQLTTSWVLGYRTPDGIRGVSDRAAERITDAMAARLAPGANRESLIANWREQLAKPTVSDRLTRDELSSSQGPRVLRLERAVVDALLTRLMATAPAEREMERDPESAITGAAHAALLRTLIEVAGSAGVTEFAVSRDAAKRLRLDPIGEAEDRTRVVVNRDTLMALAGRAETFVRQHQVEPPRADFERAAAQLRQQLEPSLRMPRSTALTALMAIGVKAVTDDRFLDPARARIDAPALGLVRKLNPATTVPARVAARLTRGAGRLPSWLPASWFDDRRIEPVMAHPRFAYPMYEPLHRYDREWMVPGLGAIEKPDMATLLQTNNRFIEAYLVGLNHEMGRELLWREFPTDQRGTYFSSFWTTRRELTADMHEPAWRTGAIGTHVDPRLDGQLVFLVRGDLIRRYPGVVAHAARQAEVDAHGIPGFEADSPIETLFHVFLPPNVLLVGFAMTRARIDTPGERWWFTLSENPTEPRFGLDASRAEPRSRDSLIWDDFGVGKPGAFLDATHHTNLVFEQSRWGASSAQVAYLLFQLPARAAFLAKTMVAKAVR